MRAEPRTHRVRWTGHDGKVRTSESLYPRKVAEMWVRHLRTDGFKDAEAYEEISGG